MSSALKPKPVLKTDAQVRNCIEPGRYSCGDGLYLNVHPRKAGGVSQAWTVRLRVSALNPYGALTARTREAGLGSYPLVTLAEARRKSQEMRLYSKDVDPLKKRDDDRLALLLAERAAAEIAQRLVTFADLANRYFADNTAGWKSEVHRRQWRNTLRTWANPIIGKMIVSEIDCTAVLRVLQQDVHEPTGSLVRQFWVARTETAGRVRQRIERILDYAAVKGLRQGDNPAQWARLRFVLPHRRAVRQVAHHAALPIDELPSFLKELRAREAMAARALEFLILTAARTSEVLKAQWCEIDLARATWTVPAHRMKSKREHRVPLNKTAITLLRKLPAGIGAAFVFPNDRGRALSQMALLALAQGRMDRQDITVHGFRSCFRDYIGERTNYSSDLAEAALAHLLGDATMLAYQRGDLFEKRRAMMEDWAAFCVATRKRRANSAAGNA